MTENPSDLYVRKVILADQTEFIGSGSTALDDYHLTLWIDAGPSLADIFTMFNNPEKTAIIQTYVKSMIDPTEVVNVYHGYTRFETFTVSGDRIMIVLGKS